MLLGSFTHTVDKKGRVFLPAKWRGELGEIVILSQALTDIRRGVALEVMSMDAYVRRKQKLINVPDGNTSAVDLKRMVMYTTSDCEVDGQGRILIPITLRELAKIEGEVVMIGMYDSVELWSPANWGAFYGKYKDDPYAWESGIAAMVHSGDE
ncbi:MAG: cell division/cell wall cluster transcriptional repressor MraZ [Clostridia bacterium]|nr:cell division/cell wall cluster transcriptional repressor MraZ [Clostridia bacterium]